MWWYNNCCNGWCWITVKNLNWYCIFISLWSCWFTFQSDIIPFPASWPQGPNSHPITTSNIFCIFLWNNIYSICNWKSSFVMSKFTWFTNWIIICNCCFDFIWIIMGNLKIDRYLVWWHDDISFITNCIIIMEIAFVN